MFAKNRQLLKSAAAIVPQQRRNYFVALVGVIGLIAVIVGMCFVAVPQSSSARQLFKVVPDEGFDQTPEQARRLAQLHKLPTTRSIMIVKIDSDALNQTQLGVLLPDQTRFALFKTGGEKSDARNFSWIGRSKEVPAEGAALVARDGQITGSISTPNGLYRLSPLGGGVEALVEVDSTKFPKDEPESFNKKESEHRELASSASAAPQNTSSGGLTQMDVLVAYTAAARAGVTDIDSTITLAVAEANQSYVNSGITIHLNLVESFQVDYSERGKSFEAILADFKKMPEVNQRRDKAGADLAALIVDQADYCGLADAIMADASTAFAVIYHDCATGYYSFAHELGHLMGARHDEQNDPSVPFSYGHGYRHDLAPSWRTIMAYDCPAHCNRLQYWSNPRVMYGGNSMGTAATNDNARVLNETATKVAAFRKRP